MTRQPWITRTPEQADRIARELEKIGRRWREAKARFEASGKTEAETARSAQRIAIKEAIRSKSIATMRTEE